MRSFLVIGAGRFGHHLIHVLCEKGCDVMAADILEEKLTDLSDLAESIRVGDCRKREVLESFGAEDFDACCVCIGDDFQASLEITDLLKSLGARYVLSLAGSDTQARFLLKNGADRVVYPARDLAERVGVDLSNDSIYDYFRIGGDYSVFEITPPESWVGKSLGEVGPLSKHGVNVFAYRCGDGAMGLPGTDYVFMREQHLMVLGKAGDVEKLMG